MVQLIQLSKSRTFTAGPLWALYTAYTVLGTIVCIPGYVAYYAFPSRRPHRRWTLTQSVTNRICRIVFNYLGETEYAIPQMTSVGPGLGDFVWLQPCAEDIYKIPPLNRDDSIRPGAIGAVWVPSEPDLKSIEPDKFICLHFHGGAFVTLSPSLKGAQTGPRILAEKLGGPVLMLGYRRACNPNGRFPAALQDAVTAYRHLLDAGVPHSKIILSGDSSGGNLVLATLRLIADREAREDANMTNIHSGELPWPAGVALWSPWVDMTLNNEEIESNPNYSSDYLTPALIAWRVREFVPSDLKRDSPYFSPGKYPFAIKVPVFVHSGTAELTSDQHREFVERFRAISGNHLKFLETQGGMHDVFEAGSEMGFAKEQAEACEKAVTFLCI